MTSGPGYGVTSGLPINSTAGHVPNVHERYDWIQLMHVFCPAALSIDRFVTPIWYIIGLHGNILSAKIWLERPMRMNNSSAIYLATLSITDFLFLCFHIIIELKYAWGVNVVAHPALCGGYFYLYLVAQYMAPMLVLGFSVERWIAVCHPFQKEKYCTPTRAKWVASGLVGIAFIVCSMQAYFWTFNPVSGQCEVRPAALKGPNGRSLWEVWTWVTETLIFGLVPLVTLCFNMLVIREVRRLSRQGPAYLPGQGNPAGSTSRATTAMLLSVSFYLIFTTLPATLVYALSEHFPQGNAELTDAEIFEDPTWSRFRAYMTSRKIVEEVCLSHYACNIFLYAITGQHFRSALINTFRCGMDKTKHGNYSNVTQKTIWHNNDTSKV